MNEKISNNLKVNFFFVNFNLFITKVNIKHIKIIKKLKIKFFNIKSFFSLLVDIYFYFSTKVKDFFIKIII